MALDHSVIGVPGEPQERSWTSKDSLLYAVGVGAGLGDPLNELEFTTENSEGITQQALPTYAVLISQASTGRSLGDFDRALLGARRAVVRAAPAAAGRRHRADRRDRDRHLRQGLGRAGGDREPGRGRGDGRAAGDRAGQHVHRGEGGYGGDRGPKDTWAKPERDADHVVTYQTRPEQALVYRLSGDRNPLHVDPKFAARGGFDRPILHGLCTYGVTGRALLHSLCGSDPARFVSMSGRFSHPVFPGDSLVVSMWVEGDEALFQTAIEGGPVVIDRGRARFRPSRRQRKPRPRRHARPDSATTGAMGVATHTRIPRRMDEVRGSSLLVR